ncbi:MAG: cupin domain-containing protein [Anaerolineae bacterium]|nr:cupin domain-containing protein [Candidatus Roseilinea sp.]MDW8451498.1 cupin domain-containing protein [Anaerolineae bacterium]
MEQHDTTRTASSAGNGRTGYTPSPRPTFERAAAIPYASAVRHLWGDKESGEVADWIYVSSDKIHSLVFGLPPRGWFRHSDSYRTIFGADVAYHVLSGVMVIANPETGEVHRAPPGATAFFRRDTWHHVFNYSDEPLRVLEFFAPPPSTGTSGAYARQKPLLTEIRYGRDAWLGRLPMDRTELCTTDTIRVIGEGEIAWRLEGSGFPTLIGLIVATEHLTVGRLHLLPGQHTDAMVHGGDKAIYVAEGTLHVRIFDGQRPDWFEIGSNDACYVPQGTAHACYNIGSRPVVAIFGVAPRYLA